MGFEVTVVTVLVCDFCKVTFDGPPANKFVRREAWNAAKEKGWRKLNRLHACPMCVLKYTRQIDPKEKRNAFS